jgi:hypothetical protein
MEVTGMLMSAHLGWKFKGNSRILNEIFLNAEKVTI